MASQARTRVPIVFGAMTIGKEGAEQSRVHSLDETNAILDIFLQHGHREVDTARVYGGGSSEDFLGRTAWQTKGITMDTKYFATGTRPRPDIELFHFTPDHIRTNMERSLRALNTDAVDMWYLHAPDRTVPLEDTLRTVNELHTQGKFRRFGVSNYMSWEVAQICEICSRNGWIAPSVYQGVYNAIHRSVEHELFPCLRKYGMGFYAFNPLAGGFLTDRYHRYATDFEKGSRFDPDRWQGKAYRGRYWNDAYFDALDIVRAACKEHGIREAEAALRWMTNHSQLSREHGDAVIIGASSGKQLEQNLADLEKGPLPENVVQAFDKAWERVGAQAWKYFH